MGWLLARSDYRSPPIDSHTMRGFLLPRKDERMNNMHKFQSDSGEINISHTKTETVINVKGIQESFQVRLSHNDMIHDLKIIRRNIDAAIRRHKKNLVNRDLFRNTLCGGCRHNYYNFQKDQDNVGVAVREDYYCWHMENVKRGKCSVHSGNAYR